MVRSALRWSSRAGLVFALFALTGGCRPVPRMCTESVVCGTDRICVGGRCEPRTQTDIAPTIMATRRLVIPADEFAVVQRGGGDPLSPVAVLGRDGSPTVVFMRFSVRLPPTTKLVEAHLLVRKVESALTSETPVVLRTARVLDAWDPRSVEWGAQPRVESVRTPRVPVLHGGGSWVRLDVRNIVRAWRSHDHHQQGIALVADTSTPEGVTLAFAPFHTRDPIVDQLSDVHLELYVR